MNPCQLYFFFGSVLENDPINFVHEHFFLEKKYYLLLFYDQVSLRQFLGRALWLGQAKGLSAEVRIGQGAKRCGRMTFYPCVTCEIHYKIDKGGWVQKVFQEITPLVLYHAASSLITRILQSEICQVQLCALIWFVF